MVDCIQIITQQEIWALALFIVGALAYTLKDLISQGKFRFAKDPVGFWGEWSYLRKYANPPQKPPNTWYCRWFKVKYKERFFLSTTALVFLTDGYHLLQFIMLKCMALVPAILLGNWWLVIPIRLTWWLVFNVSYKLFSR